MGGGRGSGGRRWFSTPPLGCLEGRKEDSKQMGERHDLFDVGSRCGVNINPYISLHRNIFNRTNMLT